MSNPTFQLSDVLDCSEIHRAMQNPVQLDQRQVDAVDARMELDLRVGASFTRFQTLSFQDWFPDLKDGVVSYGMPERSTCATAKMRRQENKLQYKRLTHHTFLTCTLVLRTLPVPHIGVCCGSIQESRELYTRVILEVGGEAQQGWCRSKLCMAAWTSL